MKKPLEEGTIVYTLLSVAEGRISNHPMMTPEQTLFSYRVQKVIQQEKNIKYQLAGASGFVETTLYQRHQLLTIDEINAIIEIIYGKET